MVHVEEYHFFTLKWAKSTCKDEVGPYRGGYYIMKNKAVKSEVLTRRLDRKALLVSMDKAKRDQFKRARIRREKTKDANYNLLGSVKKFV